MNKNLKKQQKTKLLYDFVSSALIKRLIPYELFKNFLLLKI